MFETSTPISIEKPVRVPPLRLTHRDYEIFAFLLEQGFGTLQALYFKFFDARPFAKDPLPKNFEVTRQRLRLLQRHGFIKTQKVFTESSSLFLLAPLGFSALAQKGDARAFAPPLKTVDFRWYEHDAGITYCRIALEKDKIAKNWICERRMKLLSHSHNGRVLPRHLIPDGIFTDVTGQRVAFEFERTRKARGRYQQKMSDYQALIYQGFFEKVFYVTYESEVAKELLHALQNRPQFQLTHYADLLLRLKEVD
jgi:hypothetical protein